MRRAWLAPVLLAFALLAQLTVLNGLHLPRGGVPDLVLILVVALAVAGGPVQGTVTGFAAGLCVDLAPPGSAAIGQYAFVFCLAGWMAGLLASGATRAPLRTLAASAGIIAVAEALIAGLGLLLTPAQVTKAEIRQFLPVSIGYDLLVWPFALYLVVLLVGHARTRLAGARFAATGLTTTRLASTGQSSLLAPLRRTGRSERQHQVHEPRLRPAAARSGDGWVRGGPPQLRGTAPPRRWLGRGHEPRLRPAAAHSGDGWVRGGPPQLRGTAPPRRWLGRGHEPRLRPAAAHSGDGWVRGGPPPLRGTAPPPRRLARLHPASGVPGSASGLVRPHGRPAAPVQLRLSSGRRGDGAIGDLAGNRPGGRGGAGRHPGVLPGSRFRPRRGERGGSAARQFAPAGLGLTRTRINFGGHRDDATRGRGPAAAALSASSRAAATHVPMRTGSSRSALAPSGHAGLPATVPKLRFRSAAPAVARRPPAAPKFKHATRPRTSSPTTGIVGGGALDAATFLAYRRGVAQSRLRLAARRNRAGMLGGSGRSALRRPPTRGRREPRFGSRRRSVLSVMTSRGIGGRWLARKRAGSRSGAWVIGKRTGGVR